MNLLEKKKKVREILESLTFEELKEFHTMFKDVWYGKEMEVAHKFKAGNKVKFTDGKGRQIYGTVVGCNTKTLKVNVGSVNWNVSPALLTLVAGGA